MQSILEMLTREENVRMQYEILIMLCIFSVTAIKIREKRKLAAVWGAAACVFLYLHRILLPVLVSGLYLYLLAGILTVIAEERPGAFLTPFRALRKILGEYLEPGMIFYTLAPVMILLIQAGRANIALDYDSLRYGLRSDVLLTGGGGLRGFFENTGLVNLVYTYPKGFEVLTRPLYFGHTYGYVLSVDLWMLVLVLLTAGRIARRITGSPRAEVFAACLLSLVPGVTNMAVTAKSDLITLLCQLIFVYCVVCFLSEKEREDGGEESKRRCGRLTGTGLAALALSYAMKPTAVIFSSLLGLTALCFLLKEGRKKGYRLGLEAGGARLLVLSLFYVGVITARTWIITGMPYTSVFTGVFEKLGMTLHYPFRIQQAGGIPMESLTAALRFYLQRILGLLVCPVGEDMAHVRIAWSGLAFLLALLMLPAACPGAVSCMEELNRFRQIRRDEGYEPESAVPGDGIFRVSAYRLLAAEFPVIGLASLLSLFLLWQIDGNYYMLLYALVILLAVCALYARASFETSPLGKNLRKVFSARSGRAMTLLAAVMIYFTAFTSWAGPVGLTPIDPVNRGYYNHEAELGVRDPLHWDPHTRVVAFAEDPDCWLMKGRVESWVDIDGSGGNVYLTDTKLNIFKQYCSFADIDYICADLRFLHDTENERRQRAYTLFVYMLEDGEFDEVVLAENSPWLVLARIDKERMSVDWEVPPGEEREQRTAAQCRWFREIGGYLPGT